MATAVTGLFNLVLGNLLSAENLVSTSAGVSNATIFFCFLCLSFKFGLNVSSWSRTNLRNDAKSDTRLLTFNVNSRGKSKMGKSYSLLGLSLLIHKGGEELARALEDGGTTLDGTPAVLNPEVREGRRKAISGNFMVRIN